MTHSLLAAVLDWAGTTVDYGCVAPTSVFVQMFALYGVDISAAEARGPMGRGKRDHIRAVMFSPEVQARWQQAHGHLPGEPDVDALYAEFVPHQIEAIARHSTLIPGTLDAIDAFRARGMKIGTCSGYTRAMMNPLVALTAEQGFIPDANVASDEVRAGRPSPYMCFRNAELLDVYPLWRCIKIGDTPVDIEEGRNAGMWTIALAKTGNQLGMTPDEMQAAPDAQVQAALAAARASLSAADYVVDGIGDVPALLEDIEARLAAGERPG
ncbi:MAG: phosphonoacetaldehyde hydrolase [Pleurocapsa minor GSE-CHR-MK-17-07R]|jgi:phosphonoacetaldehyde hydrolase|nr:phosphonoacetaldehyde hydrolase [Pleurocapsa minor GSE-CHR-MK 17-07R]